MPRSPLVNRRVEQMKTFDASDDAFHEIGDRWWATETAWFSLSVPERRLGGWLYVLVRPNIGTVSGGAWVWDHSAYEPWEVLHCTNYSSLRLPADADLQDVRLPTGVSIHVLEPLSSYRLGFEGEGLAANLRFDAIMAPHPFAHGEPPFLSASHFDQAGRVSGQLVLGEETIDVDCLSVRDRSWGPRPETRPRRLSYNFGTASAGEGFHVVTNPSNGEDRVNHGYLLRQGDVRRVVDGRRQVTRDPEHGWIRSETIEGVDETGRGFRADGEALSRIVINRHSAITWTTLMRWTVDGESTAWGEDQDMWPVHSWREFRRASRSLRGR